MDFIVLIIILLFIGTRLFKERVGHKTAERDFNAKYAALQEFGKRTYQKEKSDELHRDIINNPEKYVDEMKDAYSSIPSFRNMETGVLRFPYGTSTPNSQLLSLFYASIAASSPHGSFYIRVHLHAILTVFAFVQTILIKMDIIATFIFHKKAQSNLHKLLISSYRYTGTEILNCAYMIKTRMKNSIPNMRLNLHGM